MRICHWLSESNSSTMFVALRLGACVAARGAGWVAARGAGWVAAERADSGCEGGGDGGAGAGWDRGGPDGARGGPDGGRDAIRAFGGDSITGPPYAPSFCDGSGVESFFARLRFDLGFGVGLGSFGSSTRT